MRLIVKVVLDRSLLGKLSDADLEETALEYGMSVADLRDSLLFQMDPANTRMFEVFTCQG